MRTIGVVTTTRADYGIYRPILKAMRACDDLKVDLWVTGMHLAPEFGLTVGEIDRDGWPIAERIPMLVAGGTEQSVGQSMGLGTLAFSHGLSRRRPDILLVLGDRFEMFAATLATIPLRIPVAHIHGGELTLGAIDDTFRHCLTKISHLHFVSNEDHGRRVVQLGEEPWRVLVTGAPSLDALSDTEWMSADQLQEHFGIDVREPVLLVTLHPATGDVDSCMAEELTAALKVCQLPLVVTAPNADAGGAEIAVRLRRLVAEYQPAWWVDSLGSRGYFSLMRHAAAMVGNSSSGLLEAASFELPVVNIGTRQEGRMRAANVIDVRAERDAIVAAIRQATSPAFRQSLQGLQNPYGQGHASRLIAERLRTVPLDTLLHKRFHDLAPACE